MNLEIKTVCFTGHREILRPHARAMSRVLERELLTLMERGATVFRAGGAMGFDTVAALKVLELREIYPHVELELILPCRDQTAKWPPEAVRAYQYVLSEADRHRFLFDRYITGCMHERNRQLVQGSDVCVAYCYQNRGGTVYTVNYAMREGLEIINLCDLLGDDDLY